VLVAVGSTRAPKVDAVRRVLATLAGRHPHLGGALLAAREVAHGAPPMPLTTDDLLRGAALRARRALEAVRAEGGAPDLGVGMEGGLEVRTEAGGRRAFLMSWAYVCDAERGAHGCGGAIELPPVLLAPVLDQGLELSEAVDALMKAKDIRSREGAWGVFTAGLMDRTRSFELALLNAWAPFYNREVYA
jgi:inosine/xanthosine triphosphatase